MHYIDNDVEMYFAKAPANLIFLISRSFLVEFRTNKLELTIYLNTSKKMEFLRRHTRLVLYFILSVTGLELHQTVFCMTGASGNL